MVDPLRRSGCRVRESPSCRAKEASVSVKKNFYSDNVSGAAPEILEALVAANAGDTAPYGADSITEGLQARFAELFETEVDVYPVGTGTAANGLCASIVAAPYGAIYMSEAAHLHGSECGGPEFWSGGNARPIPVPTVDGKIVVAEMARMVDEAAARSATEVPPRAVSITQGTETSTVYSLSEVRGIAEAARARRLWVHMDGARLANAVARLGCTPAEATWKAGVDVLSFGATKNGALTAEAVVFFNRELAQTMRYRRRRGGHLFSKMRFLSVQLEAFIANDLWLRNARHANAMAQRVREGLAKIPGVRFRSPTEINFVLVSLPQPVWDGLVAEGYSFSRRGAPSEGIIRIACAFDTTEEAVDALVAAAHRHAGTRQGADRPAAVVR
ncbi:MAG: low specificity L-threonine aldolase [Candidatus Rokuibacteriota bacterium]|nr:MAG: low specificity L-threonine aldolase [Candidatus Rokubacteria bacterium]